MAVVGSFVMSFAKTKELRGVESMAEDSSSTGVLQINSLNMSLSLSKILQSCS